MPSDSSFDFVKRQKAQYQSVAYDTKDNALATATIAAPGAGWRNAFLRVDASFSDPAVSKDLTVKSGATTLFVVAVHGRGTVSFDSDVGFPALNQNEAISAELAASGTAGKVGKVIVQAFKVKEVL